MDKDIMKDLNKEIDEAVGSSKHEDEMDPLTDLLDEAKRETEVLIRRHPIQSVLIAAGIGFLIGSLFSKD